MFKQFYEAFGNYSPGGFRYNNIDYIKLSSAEKAPVNWREALMRLNSVPIIGGATEVRVIPDEEYEELAWVAATFYEIDFHG